MNTDRSLLFLILSLVCLWFVFDEFYGQKRITKIAEKLTPSFPTLPTPGEIITDITEKDLKDPDDPQTKEDNKKANEDAKKIEVPSMGGR